MRYWTLAGALAVLAACGPAWPGEAAGAPSPAETPAPEPPSDAEERAWTITVDRPIEETTRRTMGFRAEGVWFSNELSGGRLNDVWREGDTLFVARIRPENAPINNSAWYAFKVWSAEPRTVPVQLRYDDGRHRYWPKVRLRDGAWMPLDSAAVSVDTAANTATLRLPVGPDTLWVAGQKLITTVELERWQDSLAVLSQASREVIGTSRLGRAIHMLTIADDPAASPVAASGAGPGARPHVLLIGRQHPPEVTGTLAMLRFVEELAGDSPLARAFRQRFRVLAVPMVNPDGVDLGHWRHNVGGVDLNRDWVAFRQPETAAVRDVFLSVRDDVGAEVWFAADFHSTWYDVFYTLDRELETQPAGFIDRWLERIGSGLPHYTVSDSPSGLANSTSRNWFYREFGAPAVTYEVGDSTDPETVRAVAATAARALMELLLEELDAAEP
jgi:cytosolic carboxypeptidase protein 6